MNTTRSISIVHTLRAALLSLTVIGMLGCGFALRGNVEIPLSAQSLNLVYSEEENLSLSRQFNVIARQNGIRLSEGAEYQIRIEQVNYKRISSTFDSNALVDEYVLTAEVTFDIIDAQEEVLAAGLEAFSERSYQFDANATAASNSRESIVSAELWRNISQQILRQYAARLKSQ
ncbi:MAG: LPS assembly lipoprotein LptE [Pseudomonadales bacterium]